MPCGNCKLCLMDDCEKCVFCRDKRKFGGPGKLKKRCEMRICQEAAPRKPGTPSRPSPRPLDPRAYGYSPGQSILNHNMRTPIQAPAGMPSRIAALIQQGARLVPMHQNNINGGSPNYNVGSPNYNGGSPNYYLPQPPLDNMPAPVVLVDNPMLHVEDRIALENSIELGLETYKEVVNIKLVPHQQPRMVNLTRLTQPPIQQKALCYMCKRDNKDDLFYCSICCLPFHQFCLHNLSSTTCSRCLGTKFDHETAVNARAESIDAKCEEINGTQYQVISFLSDADQLNKLKLI